MFDIAGYSEAATLPEAFALLRQDAGTTVIAGGTDVLIKLRAGKLAGCRLVGIRGIPGLRGASLLADGTIAIGALSTFCEMQKDTLLNTRIPMLAKAAAGMGGAQVRNAATIGGNLCNGATSADGAPPLFALNARLELRGEEATRLMPISAFYKGPGKVALRHGELLTRILIAREDYQGFYGHAIKYAMRNAMDIATLNCAAMVRLDKAMQSVEKMRLAFGVAAPVPMRCLNAERLAMGQPVSSALLDEVAEAALREVRPRTSWRASEDFRRTLVEVLTKRALRQAIMDAGGVEL